MSDTNYGVSSRINIGGESLKENVLSGFQISNTYSDMLVASPPLPNEDSTPSEGMTYINKFRQFAFQKIALPLFGDEKCIARHTGIPANEPDFISDHHFISLMRIIDDKLQHKYKGTIMGDYTNVNPNG